MTTTSTSPQGESTEQDANLEKVLNSLDQIILGKSHQLRLCIACVLARGHLLIEDIPGVGKTTLAHALARALGLSYQRIQFTSDLLPADIVGVSIYDRESTTFNFHRGPVFSQLVLADEVNRATPKTQSALLEAMEENQVTADGITHDLPTPFFVVATQNPTYQIGTFPLPESQLDRFLMRIELGYPDPAVEKTLLTGRDRRDMVAEMPACLTAQQLAHLQNKVPQVHVADVLIAYVQALVAFTRESAAFTTGLSPRAAIVLLRAAQAWALMANHRGVLPEDVQAVAASVIGHRLRPRDEDAPQSPAEIGQYVLEKVAIP